MKTKIIVGTLLAIVLICSSVFVYGAFNQVSGTITVTDSTPPPPPETILAIQLSTDNQNWQDSVVQNHSLDLNGNSSTMGIIYIKNTGNKPVDATPNYPIISGLTFSTSTPASNIAVGSTASFHYTITATSILTTQPYSITFNLAEH